MIYYEITRVNELDHSSSMRLGETDREASLAYLRAHTSLELPPNSYEFVADYWDRALGLDPTRGRQVKDGIIFQLRRAKHQTN